MTDTKNEKKNKVSVLKIISRIFIYPFCLLVIYFSLFNFIPNEEYTLAIFGVLIPGAFLVSDIILIYQQLKNKTADEPNNQKH